MTDLELIVQAAKLGAAGSDNCNQVAAAIERVTALFARRLTPTASSTTMETSVTCPPFPAGSARPVYSRSHKPRSP